MTAILVCGSRSISSYEAVKEAIESSPFRPDKIIHGGARGVDSRAERYAMLNQIDFESIEPDYDTFDNNVAPLERNKKMVDMADGVIAVWDGESSGTQFTIQKAQGKGMSKLGSWEYSSEIDVIYLA